MCIRKAALIGFLMMGFVFAGKATALDVNIAKLLPYVDIQYGGKKVRIMRIQDKDHRIEGGFTKTSRPCPPFCFQPMSVSPGVTTVGEVEVVKFIARKYKTKQGLIVDARTQEWFESGTIPGSVNIPFTVFNVDMDVLELEGDDSAIVRAMRLFGVKKNITEQGNFFSRLFSGETDNSNKKLDFSKAKDLLVFCNGPWCEQSPRAIHGLLEMGYPPEKLFYYRGGMQLWQMGGFTTVSPEL